MRSLLAFCALSATLSAAEPLPDKAALESAQRLVRETYRDDLGSEGGLRKVLREADGLTTPADQAAAYVVVARSAQSGGWLRIGFEAIDHLARRFDYDGPAAKASLLEGAVKSARSVESRVSIVNRCLELLEESIAGERFEVGEQALKLASSTVAKIRDPELRKELASKRKAFETLRKESESEEKAVDQARSALKRDERDPKANETMGKRLAMKGDWTAAVLRLGRAGDEGLRRAADLDGRAQKDGKLQLAAADAWWGVAEGADGKGGRAFRARAVFWYSLAAPSLTGLAKAKVERRIEEAGKVDLSGTVSGGDDKVTIFLPGSVPLVLVKIPASDKVPSFWLGQTEVTEAQWAAVMGGEAEDVAMPKVDISLNDAKGFVDRLNKMAFRFSFRIPSVEEVRLAIGLGSDYGPDNAWLNETSATRAHRVAQKTPNKLGLFDIAGNVWEFCGQEGMIFGIWPAQPPANAMETAHRPAGAANYKAWNLGLRLAADLR